MSKLTDEQITGIWIEYEGRELSWRRLLARAIESAATEPLLQRIAELEAANEAFVKRQSQWNLRMIETERQLEEARKQALEEAAKVCDERAMKNERACDGLDDEDATSLRSAAWQMSVCAAAIRALKGAKE